MEVIQVFDRPASRCFYTVAGRFLFVETTDLRLARLLEGLFAGWQLTPVSSPDREAEIEIRFFNGSPAPEIPHTVNQFEIADGGRCYAAADSYYLQFENSLMRLRQSGPAPGGPVQIDVWVREAPETADAELAHVTSFAVCAALRRFNIFDLHSAAVVEPESGNGVLIVGSSGSGKSTLTFNLAQAGWSYLSDDEVLLSLHEDKVEARGFRSFFALREMAPAGNHGFRNVFEPAGVFSSTRTPQITPRWVLFTRLSGEEETQLSRLPQTETMTRLIRACPWATYDTAVAAANLELLSRLARQVTAFDLAAGSDLLDPARAAGLLIPHLARN
ncbi:MAG TPA: hypothetical protein VJT15_13720 [Pyrinomonadaceae bacterium]|nr:hypothetical protein [Pyrinomonadaceae bacterium]